MPVCHNPACQRELPPEQFKPDKRLKGGRERICRTCRQARQAAQRREKRAQAPAAPPVDEAADLAPDVALVVCEHLDGQSCHQCGRPPTGIAELTLWRTEPWKATRTLLPFPVGDQPATVLRFAIKSATVLCAGCVQRTIADPALLAWERQHPARSAPGTRPAPAGGIAGELTRGAL